MKNLAESYNLKCEKSVQPMGSTSLMHYLQVHLNTRLRVLIQMSMVIHLTAFIG